MIKVIRYRDRDTGELEPLDVAMKRFKRAVANADIMYDYKKHEFFLKKSLRRKQKSEEAARRKSKNYKPKGF